MTLLRQPAGTVTMVFTDIEGSTKLLERLGTSAYREALAEHRRIVREACARHSGYEVDYEGDAFFYAFPSAEQALAAVSETMAGLAEAPIRIRVGIHTGEPALDPPKYVGTEVHRAARIMAAGHGGQVLLSQATRMLLGDRYPLSALGEHRFKDLPEPVALYQLGEGSFPPLKTISNTNLPRPASSFVGRELELAEVVALLTHDDVRLLTLTGPGGTGKTRLAIEAAARAAGRFPDGVHWVALAPLRDPELVLPSIARALGATMDPAERIADSRVLLLLDNFEQVVQAAPLVGDLVGACTGLRVLVTSRETLRIQAEVEYAVSPLAVDDGVRLFQERAHAASTDRVADLCQRLDGLPLAIELAAARAKLFSSEELLGRLTETLDLLKGGRDSDPRQQTLRATIGWSHDLLDESEQRLFCSLSVFRGGCLYAAAEDVANADPDTLQSLLEKSLLRRRDTDLGTRYSMLETIREFAAEKLVDAGMEEELRNRHAEFMLALAEELEPPLMSIAEPSTRRLGAETDNIRAAIEFLSEDHDPTRELRLVGSLFRFWETSGLIVDGRRLAERALARSSQDDAGHVRAKVLYAASLCASYQGDFEICNTYDEERLVIARELGDLAGAAVALSDLGLNAMQLGDLERAALRIEESRALAIELGADDIVAATTDNLALVALVRGEPDLAHGLLEAQLATLDDNDVFGRLMLTQNLGWALLERGELGSAGARLREALAASVRFAGPFRTCGILDALAAVAVARGDAIRAARLAGAAGATRAEHGALPVEAFERMRIEGTEQRGRVALGSEFWDAEYGAGMAMSLSEAVAYALEDAGEE